MASKSPETHRNYVQKFDVTTRHWTLNQAEEVLILPNNMIYLRHFVYPEKLVLLQQTNNGIRTGTSSRTFLCYDRSRARVTFSGTLCCQLHSSCSETQQKSLERSAEIFQAFKKRQATLFTDAAIHTNYLARAILATIWRYLHAGQKRLWSFNGLCSVYTTDNRTKQAILSSIGIVPRHWRTSDAIKGTCLEKVGQELLLGPNIKGDKLRIVTHHNEACKILTFQMSHKTFHVGARTHQNLDYLRWTKCS